ncbi:MAG: hypothetical protein D6702_09600 [Planctomycetota bacterium]|nr:MAG: hypothetical protein D6702_09600 [Planctomycetota bacterium]
MPAADAGGGMSLADRRLAAWLEGALLAAAVLAVLVLGGEVVRASYHGFLHAAVGEAVLREGLRPENPYHAGAPLRYYTLYPMLGVLLGRLGGGPLLGFALLDVLAALLFAPALDSLGRAAGLSGRARRWTFLAAVFGFNALGWLGFLLAGGEAAAPGAAPVLRLAPLTFAGTPIAWDQRLQAFLPKFLNVSSFAPALPFVLWAWSGALPARAGGAAAGTPWRVAAAAAAALALNPLAGGFAGLVLALWLAPVVLRGPRRGSWLLAGGAAVLLALPFLLPAFQPAATGGPRVEVRLGGHPLSDLLGPLVLLLPFGLVGLCRLPRGTAWRWGVAAGLAAVFLVAAELPWGNEYKMARIGGILWALPAGAALAELHGRSGLLRSLFLLLALPTTAAVPWAYLAWAREAPPLPIRTQGGRLAPAPGTPPPPALLAAEAEADPRAAVLADPFGLAGALGGGRVQGHPLAPLLHHPLVVDRLQVHNEGQPDLDLRLRCAHGLFVPGSDQDPAPLLTAVRRRLAGRPLLVFTGPEDPGRPLLVGIEGARILAEEDGFGLWLLPPMAAIDCDQATGTGGGRR